MATCTLSFPEGFIPQYRDIFCQLQEAESAFPWSDYEGVTGATPITDATAPLAFSLDTTKYLNHPTEIYGNWGMQTIDHYTDAPMVGVSHVESAGNGDQGRFWNSDAKNGNLYLLTSPGKCQDLSPQVDYTSFRRNDFDRALRSLGFAQRKYNDRKPVLSLFGFPGSVAEAKQNPPVIVTVLPGPSATHVPDGPEGTPGAGKQGEWPLGWSAVTYIPAKPAVPLSASLPAEFVLTFDRCSRVVQAHSESTPIIQFSWNILDVMRAGALTVAHDITNFKAVLRDDVAKATSSVFKITLKWTLADNTRQAPR